MQLTSPGSRAPRSGRVCPASPERPYSSPLPTVGHPAVDESVQPPRPKECRVDEVRPRGGGEHADSLEPLHAIQLGQELVHHPVGHTCRTVWIDEPEHNQCNIFELPTVREMDSDNLHTARRPAPRASHSPIPVESCPLGGAMASNSSKNKTQGAAAAALQRHRAKRRNVSWIVKLPSSLQL